MKILRKRRLYIALTLILLLFLLLVAAAYYISGRAAGIAKPWVWNRNDNAATKQNAGLHFTAHAGVTKSNINSFAASSTITSGNSRLDFSSVVVRAGNDHPLALFCAEKIAEKLKTIPTIQRIIFAPRNPIIAREELLPSQTVWVDVDNLNEHFLPNRSLTGDVHVAFGVSASRQPAPYGDGNAAPLVQFAHSATHSLRFTLTGISTQSVFYGKIADGIAERTVKTIAETIDKLSETSPPLPKMPETFYPAYREASEVPPIPGLVSATMIIDGRRFMMPHYSLVQIESNFEGTEDEFLTALQQAMSENDWKGGVNKQGEFNSAYMRLTRGTETFYIHQEHRSHGLRLDFHMRNNEQKPLPVDGPPHIFMVERTEKMPQDSVLSAIQSLLDENASPSLLLMFTHRLYGNRETAAKLEEQIRERLLGWRPDTPAEQLSLVRFFNREEDKEIAQEMLLKAWQTRQLSLKPLPDSDYTKLAEDLGIEDVMKAMPPPTPELCEDYGFILLTPENCPMEVEFELGEEVQFITVNDEGHLALIRFVFRHENGSYHTEGVQMTFREHGHSRAAWSSRGTQSGVSFPNAVHQSLPRGDQERFTFSVTAEALPMLRVRVEFRER